ncbi:hypothetical protein MGSAQ_000275 [marine sediment metagenome]|uniref:Uncharacterized protein n=1 Tax=marine sediment metagenome TaxID=412755 RepID=A0A1B6NXT5_9ZZZZ
MQHRRTMLLKPMLLKPVIAKRLPFHPARRNLSHHQKRAAV